MALLTVNDINSVADGKTALVNISFTQEPFEQIAIAGETGSGKTTLLKIIGGFVQPTGGKVMLSGERVLGPDEQLIPGHKKIAYLSQHFELRNNYHVFEVLDMANKLSPGEAGDIYAICRIEHLLDRWTDELSGGEKQRIALARLLSTSPKLLLLDEPFSNLDLLHKTLIKSVLRDACEKMGISCILVSHDAADILSWADTIFLMKNGQIIQRGTARSVYEQPVSEYAAGLLGAYNLFNDPASHKKRFARPENIRLVPASDEVLRGIVKRVLYWGSYYTVDIMSGSQMVRVQMPQAEVKEGEEVGFRVDKTEAWYL